jgi:glyoxylase-like metal-dependent hydrolase (beta-lactamase superfamily II)
MFNPLYAKILLTTLTILLLNSSHAFDDVKVTSTAVTENIHMLVGKGGNVGVFVGNDGTFIIDDQFAPLTEKLMAAIKSVGGDTPKFLLNTHFHGDHSGGNENFGKKGAMIVSHDNVRDRLMRGSVIKEFDMKTPPAVAVALPVITYAKYMHLHINGEDVNVVHVPNAHTDGDSFVHFKNANVVHAGDVFFNGFYPFIDSSHGGSMKGTIAAVDAILTITNADSKIIPGHGPLADKKQLEDYKSMLETAYASLLKLKKEGLSAADAIAKKPLASLDAEWSDGMFSSDKWLEIVYPAVSD